MLFLFVYYFPHVKTQAAFRCDDSGIFLSEFGRIGISGLNLFGANRGNTITHVLIKLYPHACIFLGECTNCMFSVSR